MFVTRENNLKKNDQKRMVGYLELVGTVCDVYCNVVFLEKKINLVI